MNAKVTVLIGIACAFIVSIGLWFAVPQVQYAPHGIFLPAKDVTPYTGAPSATVFIIDRFPMTYQALGTINVEQHFNGHNQQQVQTQVLDYAKQLAAQHGATALVVTQAYFDKPTGPEAGLGALHFQGIAIKVTQVNL